MVDQVECISACDGGSCSGVRAALAVRSNDGLQLTTKYDGDSIFFKLKKTSADCTSFALSGVKCPTDLPEIDVMALPVAP